MAAKKKTTRKRRSRPDLLKDIDKELKALTKSIDKRLAPLRKEIEKAERRAGTEGARLLREARKRLNQVQIKGHSDVNKFIRSRRRDLSKALTDLEHSVRPARKTAKKKKAKTKKATA